MTFSSFLPENYPRCERSLRAELRRTWSGGGGGEEASSQECKMPFVFDSFETGVCVGNARAEMEIPPIYVLYGGTFSAIL